ncbi:anthranilate synthase component I [Algiphilus sp.]|uniref:anthranilate synthase component I n=1 Tax=Algiphilus sp. TaxID=1872431 RepID=UPI003C6793CE
MGTARRSAAVRTLPADLDTPVGVYRKLGNRSFCYLFESMQGGERWGRYSFIGLPAREILRLREGVITRSVDGEVVEEVRPDAPMAWLRDAVARDPMPPDPRLPRFDGGWVGYIGYDCVRYVEPRVACANDDPLGLPEALLMKSEDLVIFDNQRGLMYLVTHHAADDAEAAAAAEARLDAWQQTLAEPVAADYRMPDDSAPEPDFVSGMSRDAFCGVVERIREYIRAGDVMQVVPSQRLSAPFEAEPLALYRAIRRLNPSPYLYCLNLDDHHVVGSSPEILVRVEDGEMHVRPIAGTRPRGATDEEDVRLAEELLADPKELAEHLMLIDLGRNDVGRVCETGSVRLTERMLIERYSHVMHIVSNVVGRLPAGTHALDALMAAFPTGTLSGAPKVRAMEIIEELEPVRRGIYGGAVGYIGGGGNLDMAIAIRTAVIHDGRVHVQSGAGVVADSDPDAEWVETMNKARAMLRAVGEAR